MGQLFGLLMVAILILWGVHYLLGRLGVFNLAERFVNHLKKQLKNDNKKGIK